MRGRGQQTKAKCVCEAGGYLQDVALEDILILVRVKLIEHLLHLLDVFGIDILIPQPGWIIYAVTNRKLSSNEGNEDDSCTATRMI